jgi:acyl-coenzyme A thioesterase PaaI-like protein
MNSAAAPLDAAVVARVRASFARQGAMATLGTELADVAAGRVAIALPIEPRLSQQDGFLHGASSSPRSTARAATPR